MAAIKEDDSAKNEPVPNAAQDVAFCEDDIDLKDYFVLLWKHKYLIVTGSILPALIIGSVLFFSPRQYKLTYTYSSWELDGRNLEMSLGRFYSRENLDMIIRGLKNEAFEKYVVSTGGASTYGQKEPQEFMKNFEMFLDGFYSGENLDKIIHRLKNEGFEKYAVSIGNASVRGRKLLQKLILFEVWPLSMDRSGMTTKAAANMEAMRQHSSPLVKMTITARPQSDVAAIASIVRNNVENVTPLFDIERELIAKINEYRMEMAQIEENRFGLELSLKSKTNVLAQLKDIKVEVPDMNGANFALQFNIGDRSEYLPLAYHIRAAEIGIIELKEEVRQNEDEYTHYKELAALNEKLLAEIRNSKSTEYTVGQFRSFLGDLAGSSEKTEVKDYLAAYIKKLENRMLSRVPVTDTPKTYSLGRGTVKKTGIAFAVFLMVSVFAAFLIEGVRQRHAGPV